MIVRERIAQPDEVAIGFDRPAEQGVGNNTGFVATSLLFPVAGVVNITENENGLLLRHRWRC